MNQSYSSPPSWASLPFPSPPVPSRFSRSPCWLDSMLTPLLSLQIVLCLGKHWNMTEVHCLPAAGCPFSGGSCNALLTSVASYWSQGSAHLSTLPGSWCPFATVHLWARTPAKVSPVHWTPSPLNPVFFPFNAHFSWISDCSFEDPKVRRSSYSLISCLYIHPPCPLKSPRPLLLFIDAHRHMVFISGFCACLVLL